ncbi:NAD(P)-dependent oxidoreductase [Microbacterium sp. NPDC087589]|uniref:NAD(P)-dependent oxidoreductase n=1 Tax=Microbacterium sp. NPDC087589 TaxID=3364191 RepID=UPI003830510C
MKVLVPDTISLDLDADVDVVNYVVGDPLPAEHADADVLVVWQNPQHRLEELATALTRVRLVQTLAAGPDAVIAAGFAPEAVIASGRSLHDTTVAEHALALTLALVRRLDLLLGEQREGRWAHGFVAVQQAPQTQGLYTLSGAAVTIWGFGSIALELAPLLTALGADVFGVAQSDGERGGYPVVAAERLDERLAVTDVLISILPASKETLRAMDRERFSALKQGAVFVNVGRGATVDESALLGALRDGSLRAAALDVMQVEPLPADSELWTAPNLILTPHVAGNRPRGATALVRANLTALRNGSPVRNSISR